ncbi:allantoinase AllB [Yimella sp. cx-573]|nr:allantoinase AllB [Yimella sp. cx-573]
MRCTTPAASPSTNSATSSDRSHRVSTEDFDLVIRARQALIDGALRGATIGVRDGVVAQIGELDDEFNGTDAVSLPDDHVLLPGMIDTHVHINDPGRSDWEGFETATRAALKGGYTTLVDMPLNSLPSTVSVDALETKKAAAEDNCFVDMGFWGGAIPGNIADLEPLHKAGVFGFKCFLADSGVPEFPPLDAQQLEEHLTETARIGALMIVHAEDPATLDAAPVVPGRLYSDFLASRPDACEVAAIRVVIEAVRRTGARAHILHLSSALALDDIRAAKSEGLPLTVETCPHYLSFTAETIREGSTAHKCCPPIRGQANQDALWEGLRDGTIDCVVSDHSPSTAELKQTDIGDFSTAWGGVSSIQVAFTAVWTAARDRGFELCDVVRWMCEKPAQIVGLRSKGAIAVGNSADLIDFAPNQAWEVRVDDLEHKNKISAYDGLQLTGQVEKTWLRGSTVSTASAAGTFLQHDVD